MTMPPTTSSCTSFFKVILTSTLQNGKLKIPKRFVKDHGDELRGRVSFSIPPGSSWSVSVQKESDGSIWFHDGFLKFMEDNSIGNEFFLMFKYNGGSKFSVIIFDLTATEIQYNCNNASTSDVNQIQNSDTLEGIGDSQKAARGDDSIEFLGSSASHLFSPISDVCYNKQSKERTEEAENKSLPNFFEVTLTPTYINMRRGYLNVPSKFAQLLAPPDSTRLIKIEDANNNDWVVGLIRKPRVHRLSQGWLRFVREKKLMVGDVCRFEHVRGDEVKMKVIISRPVK